MKPVHKISIITPSFNQAEYIERTILSVTGQVVSCELEYLVTDGGSTDGTIGILEKYRDHLTYTSEPDNGMTDALNKGFARATGDVLAWLNSDDLYLPGTLQKVASYFNKHPDCLWLYGNCNMVDENDREVRKWITAYKKRKTKRFNFNRLLVENYISQPAVFFRREALMFAGPIDTELPTAMDYDLWLRMAKLGEPGVLSDTLASFRVHRASISARQFRRQFEEQYAIHKKYDSNPVLLFRHRLMITVIVGIYHLLRFHTHLTQKTSSPDQ
jgi:glycosyltransferase involved in cell wall biosynthesis